ncbi:uncharacterized protein N0V89_008349 [Didymosphaeria variabile]|uniref:C4-dicarboxylate/malic acid transporter n=1 Tax=Didymosphaeria variabile TaxID=1932322 RepID=A0A9W9C8F5_9PLEO|nr:uncharacterized protein N0V89_008349 [Didymosphaeria variabile]KAJ4349731.1 hypothetical protein N0V89_008349 [Didymosphaeria variabile]
MSAPTAERPRPQIPSRRSSVESTSSAAERLRWRNHPEVTSPGLDRSNPFEDDHVLSHDFFPSSSDNDGFGDGDDGKNGDPEKRIHRKAGKAQARKTTSDAGDMGVLQGAEKESDERRRLSWRERIRHFTWTWFCMTMATGGIANVLYTVPFRFHGIYALGCIFFILNIVLFLFNVIMISLRFYWFPKTFKASFLHPTESLFIPAAIISFGTILINISQYGVDQTGVWLEKTMMILFWIDCGLAISFSIGIYLIMWSTQTFTISQMTPVWIFPAYPLLIIGPHAGNLAPKISDPNRALLVILSGYVIQGIGFLVSLMIYSAFIYRLMTQKLPRESLRPGMFISVGPSGFTISGIVTMGQALPEVVPEDFMGKGMGELAGKVGMIVANFMGLWLWGLALWFFLVSVGAHYSCVRRGKMDFAMTWYSFIFPNTALTTATFAIAKALDGNRPIQYVGCAMTILVIVTWLVVFSMMFRAVKIHQILWPQKQEDRTEGGWKQQSAEEQRRRRYEGGLDGSEEGRSRGWSMVRTLSRRGRPEGDARKRGWSFRTDPT